jgi:hypothetical protein
LNYCYRFRLGDGTSCTMADAALTPRCETSLSWSPNLVVITSRSRKPEEISFRCSIFSALSIQSATS